MCCGLLSYCVSVEVIMTEPRAVASLPLALLVTATLVPERSAVRSKPIATCGDMRSEKSISRIVKLSDLFAVSYPDPILI